MDESIRPQLTECRAPAEITAHKDDELLHLAEPRSRRPEDMTITAWNNPNPVRKYERERNEGVSVFRGLFFAVVISVALWGSVAAVVAAAITAIGAFNG